MLVIKTVLGETTIQLIDIFRLILISPFFFRYLGVENYGVYMYIIATAGIFSLFFNLGTSGYLSTYYNNVDEDKKINYLSTFYTVNSFTFSVFLVIFIFYINYYNINFMGLSTEYVMPMAIIAIVNSLIHAPISIARYQKKLRKVYSLMIFNLLLTVGVIVYAIYFDITFYKFILYYMFADVLYLLVIFWYLRDILFKFSFKHIKNMTILKSSLFLMFSTLTVSGLSYTDKFMIKEHMTNYDLGIYTFAIAIASLVLMLSSILFPIIKTKINEHIKSHKEMLKIEYFNINVINVFAIPIVMGIGFYGYNFVIFYAGDEFKDSYKYMIFLLPMIYFRFILYFYIQKYMLQNRERAIKQFFKLHLFSLIINLILNIIMIPQYGLYGALIATVITYFMRHMIILKITKSFSVLYDIFRYIVPALIVWNIGYSLWDDSYGFWLMWVYCIISMLIYWGLIYLFYNKDVKKLYYIVKEIND